jgi:large subunit ribosomal protein L18
MKNLKLQKRTRTHKKIRSRVSGTEARPRLAVFRSNEYIYAQLINDDTAKTVAGTSDIKIKKGSKIERAKNVGTAIAEMGKKSKITAVVFDRGGFSYKGRVAALADAARAAGLEF